MERKIYTLPGFWRRISFCDSKLDIILFHKETCQDKNPFIEQWNVNDLEILEYWNIPQDVV